METEKEREMIKFMWDVCIPHEFVSFMLKHNNFNIISQPNLTYQKANAIVKSYILEDGNRINQLKYKMVEKFNLVHYVYSFLYAKIYIIEKTLLVLNEKTISISNFKCGEKKNSKNLLTKN